MRAEWRRALRAGGLSAAMVLCTLGLQPLHWARAQDDGIHGPYVGAPAWPTIVDLRTTPRDTGHRQLSVDLRTAPRGTGHRQPPILPDLYPGGLARLDREKAAALRLPPSPGIRTVSAAAPGALATASLIAGTGFDGIDAAESFCACMPPDGAIAASPAYLLATVNAAFAIWDKSGHPLLGGPTSLSGLFGGCLATYPHMSDPFTDYDAANQRFVLGILTYDDGYNSSLCMAVSQTSDPTMHWNVYSFPVSSTPNNDLLDFPRATIASNAIYVSGNLFHYQPGTPLCPNGFCFLGAGLYAYDKTQMYQGQPTRALGFTIAGYDSLTPARTVGISDPTYSSGADYFTAADNICSVVTCNTIRAGEVIDPDGCTIWHFEEYARAGSLWGDLGRVLQVRGLRRTRPRSKPVPNQHGGAANRDRGAAHQHVDAHRYSHRASSR